MPLDSSSLIDPKLVVLTAPRSSAAEQYRALRTNLEFLSISGPLVKVMVTSGTPGAGKSLTSSNLAISLAQGGKNTLLVDADLRRPMIHHLFGNGNLSGLTTALTHPEEWHKYVVRGPIGGLSIMTSGPIPPNPSEMMSSPVMAELLDQLGQAYDVVILDTPPVVSFTDAVALSQTMDGVILVIRAGHTSRKIDLKGKERLTQVNARILGVVLNDVEMSDEDYSYYYGYGDRKS